MRTENPADVAAERRADYVRALNEEREMCERASKADRVKAIDAELERVGGKPASRQAPPSSTASTPAAPAPAPVPAAPAAKKAAAKKAAAKKV